MNYPNYPKGSEPKPIKIEKATPIKKSKYKNKKVKYDNEEFDSIKEKNRYIELKSMQENGLIRDLRRQVKFEILPKFKIKGETIRPIYYICDFMYDNYVEYIVEDVKGIRTKDYLLKKKMFEYKYQIKINEV